MIQLSVQRPSQFLVVLQIRGVAGTIASTCLAIAMVSRRCFSKFQEKLPGISSLV